MRDEIVSLNKVLRGFIEETIGAIKNKKSQNRSSVGPLKDDMDEKIKKFKAVKEHFLTARAALEEAKKLVDLQQEKVDKIKLKMKKYQGSGEDIRGEIRGLQDQISNSKLSVKQEKDVVAKISQLEMILPYSAQCDEF